MKRVRETRAYRAARARTIRLIGGLVALVVAGHALVKVLVSTNRQAGDWEYLGICVAVAVAVWLVTLRAASSSS